MNKISSKKIIGYYKDCNMWTRLYVKIRLLLTPFGSVVEYMPKKGVVYDLGCGFGIFSNLMAFQSSERKVIGIDLSKKRIESASKTIGKRKNIKFIHGNLKDMRLEKCATIVIYDVLHHMDYKSQEILIKECYEKLEEDGLLIIKDNDTTPEWKFLWNYLHELITMFLLITKTDRLSFRTKSGFLELLFNNGFIVEAVNIPTKLPYPFILYRCKKVKKEKSDKGLVLVNPPLSLEERYGTMAKGGRNAPPLGLCSLAAVSREKGYKSYLIDAPALNYNIKEVVRDIVRLSPKYVGITASTVAIDSAGKLATAIKKINKDIVIIVGGSHVTALPEKTLLKYPNFDIGVIGEGEAVLIELLLALDKNKPLETVQGLSFRQNKQIIVTPRNPYLTNLDILPVPAWDLLPSLGKHYRSSPQSFDRLPSTSLVTSRGCPNQCTFCDRSIFGNRLRGFSPDYVIKLLKILTHQYGIKHVLFDDDTFTILRDRLKEICHLIIQEKLDLTWTCLARVDTVDEEILSLMKKAGCWQVLYGIESGNQNVMDSLHKGITIGQVEEALKITHKAGIKTKGFFILGSPYETKETARETIEFIKKIDLDDFHMTYFTPFPGTEIFNNKINNKIFYEKEWSKMNEWTPIFIPKGFSSEELVALSKKAFREFYFRPKIIWSYLSSAFISGNFTPIFFGANALIKYLFLSKSSK